MLRRIHGYLEPATPSRFVSRESGDPIADLTRLTDDAVFEPGAFRPISYEWGVTYSGMLLAAEATGDTLFREYADKRLRPSPVSPPLSNRRITANPGQRTPFRSVLDPRSP